MSMAVSDSPPEPAGKRERTRAALIAAASEVMAEKGIPGASLEEIARRAAMTKGAIYSNFKNKSELLMAVRASRAPMLRPRFEPGAPLKRQFRIIAELLADELPRIQAEARFLTEYNLYAKADPEFAQALETQYQAIFDGAGDRMSGYRLLIPARDLMVIVQTLAQGFVYQSFLTPRDVTREVIIEAFEALADGMVAPPA